MFENLKNILSIQSKARLKSYLPYFMLKNSSYSQCGEDLLVGFVLDLMVGSRPKRYLDIGANHPYFLSNTALFYSRGGSGILVEPDPHLAKLLSRSRPRDTVLQQGVHFSGESTAEFYVMDVATLNTFSQTEMERCVAMGHKVRSTLSVELENINVILGRAGNVDFMNIDVEGLDRAILEMVDWEKYRPICICVETLTYEKNKEPRKLNEIIELMIAQDYILYADTFINSIFVDRRHWIRRWREER